MAPASARQRAATRLGGKSEYCVGSVFECSGSLGSELPRQVQLAADMFRRLQRPLFQRKCISLKTRMVVYKCMVLSLLCYMAARHGTYHAPQLQYLEVFHRAACA